MTASLERPRRGAICGLLAVLAGCADQAARAPNPTAYRWPERFAYRVQYVSETRRDREPLVRYDETKTMRFEVRDDGYLVWHDSVLKTSEQPGRPPARVPYVPEDTLQFTLRLGRQGELGQPRVGCDPAVPECKDALPSSLPLELRRIVPRLPVWEAPKGATWEDTLSYDDLPRPRGSRGYVVTSYSLVGDTTVGDGAYWVVGWRSLRRSYRGSGGRAVIAVETPVGEQGATFVDKRRLIPVYAIWAGAVPAPPALRALGATATGFRGRAALVGTVFDSLMMRER